MRPWRTAPVGPSWRTTVCARTRESHCKLTLDHSPSTPTQRPIPPATITLRPASGINRGIIILSSVVKELTSPQKGCRQFTACALAGRPTMNIVRRPARPSDRRKHIALMVIEWECIPPARRDKRGRPARGRETRAKITRKPSPRRCTGCSGWEGTRDPRQDHSQAANSPSPQYRPAPTAIGPGTRTG